MPSNIDQIKVFFPLETWDNNKILRKICDKVDIFDNEFKEFCECLLDLMYWYDWVGLAAPQIWHNIRAVAVTIRKEEKKWKKLDRYIIDEMVMVNPESLSHSEEKKKWEEACLSVPGICGDVERRSWVVVKYQDKKWKEYIKKFTGFTAVVIQHEMDHLEWILFTDKVIWNLRKFDNN